MTERGIRNRAEVWKIVGETMGAAIQRSNKEIAHLAGQIKVPPEKICLALEGKISLNYKQLLGLAGLTKMPAKDWEIVESALSSIGEKYTQEQKRTDPGLYYAVAVQLKRKGLRAHHFKELTENEKFAALAAQLIKAAYSVMHR